MTVLVVGAGVIGLTAAIRLREAGVDARVIARDLPERTTSAVAAALWYPYRAFPVERVAAWSAQGFRVLEELAGMRGSGVRMRWGTELVLEAAEDPWWRPAVRSFERTADGYRFEAPVADMSVHLPWLAGRLEVLGGTLDIAAKLDRLQLLDRAPVVVNCAGLGARELVGDPSFVAVRGHVLRAECPAIDEWFLDQADAERLVYVVPRERDVVLGGTAEEGEDDTRPSERTAEEIRARCVAAMPALEGARVLGTRVGLRPARSAVRLEAEPRSGGTVVHCYGHGGAGVTLAWGCAEEVVRLARAAAG